MEYLIIQILSSSVIALIAVWFDRKLRDKKELDSLINSIIFELTENLRIARTIKHTMNNELKTIRQGGWPPTPDPTFLDIAYSRATLSEAFFNFFRKKKLSALIKKLHDCYTALQVVNYQIRNVNNAKFEVLTKPSMLPKRIEEILQKRKETIVKVIEPTITELLLLFAQIEPKFQDTIKPFTTTQEIKIQPNRKSPSQITKEKCKRIDRIFEIGLLLATVLSASILQYASTKYVYEGKLTDLDFAFKELTIPIIILILLWLIKELFPRRSLKWLHLKRWAKEFCWAFLNNFLVLGILSFIIVSFTTDIYLLSSITITMMLIALVLTFPISWNYRKCEQENGKFKSRGGSIVMTIAEHIIIYAISYFILVGIILVSNLPAP